MKNFKTFLKISNLILIGVFGLLWLFSPFRIGFSFLEENTISYFYLMLVTLLFALFPIIIKQNKKEISFFSFSSPAHLIVPLEIYLFCYLITNNIDLSIIISIGGIVLFELIEFTFQKLKYYEGFTAENIKNRVTDLFLGFLGIYLAWYISL